MGKKDKMLWHITNNADWFMTTESFEVIPYDELSSSVFNRARQYFANDAEYSDVVCLISTSVFDTGKSGILFTTDYVYSKAWGGFLTSTYKNWLFSSWGAEFSEVMNEFDVDRMREIMSDLADMAIEEDEKEEKEQKAKEMLQKAEQVGKVLGAATLGAMAIADLASSIGDALVEEKTKEISDQILELESDSDPQITLFVDICKEFIPLFTEFAEILEEGGGDTEEEELEQVLQLLAEILSELYKQIESYGDLLDDDDADECMKGFALLSFWADIFADGDQFRNKYDTKILQNMPELWREIMEIMDSVIENDSFSSSVLDFSEIIIQNENERFELMSDSEWDEDFIDDLEEIVESNQEAIEEFKASLIANILYLGLFSADEEDDWDSD